MENIGVSIVNALNDAVKLILTFIPRLVGFLIILIVGLIIAWAVSKALTFLLRKIGFDRISDRIGLTRFEGRMGVKMDSAGILGKIVFWFLFLVFLVPAADALGVPAVSNILNQLVAYIPNVFVAILVLFLGALAGTVVADLVRGATASANIGNPNMFATIARWAIIGFAALYWAISGHVGSARSNGFGADMYYSGGTFFSTSLRSLSGQPALQAAVSAYESASSNQQTAWTSGSPRNVAPETSSIRRRSGAVVRP